LKKQYRFTIFSFISCKNLFYLNGGEGARRISQAAEEKPADILEEIGVLLDALAGSKRRSDS
jgi:hypothetical protein